MSDLLETPPDTPRLGPRVGRFRHKYQHVKRRSWEFSSTCSSTSFSGPEPSFKRKTKDEPKEQDKPKEQEEPKEPKQPKKSKQPKEPKGSKKPSRKKRRTHRSTQSHVQPDLGDAPPRDLSPNAAFRESLFDAMGDDEGAAYWESVYGQPIHNYAVPSVERPGGELEQMNDEEYAAYVRARMWARTREGMLEQQEQQREQRRKQKERERKTSPGSERKAFQRVVYENMRQTQERKLRRQWEGVWVKYLSSWTEIETEKNASTSEPTTMTTAGAEAEAKAESTTKPALQPLRNLLFWPVLSGKRCDVTPEAVKEFMMHAPAETLPVILKTERVRWHPDKMQQRYSVLGIDEVVLRSVTQVFQIIDQMWSEQRERKK